MKETKEVLDNLIVIPGKDMRRLCKQALIASDVEQITKSQIKNNETDECYFVPSSSYFWLLNAVTKFLTIGEGR